MSAVEMARLRSALAEIRDMRADPALLTAPARVIDQLQRCRDIARRALSTETERVDPYEAPR